MAENFLHKNRLQEYTQKSSLPLPVYQTINEGSQHAPQFRSTVVVDGKTFTSPRTFIHRKAAEQDVAKLALEGITWKIRNEGVPLTHEDTIFCKSILHEYATKLNLEKPTYSTSQAEGLLPAFISSVVFNGQTYTGIPARNKKEAQHMAARAVIEFILANSDTGTVMSQIIKAKSRLYSGGNKGSQSGSLCDRNGALRSHTENNTNSGVVQGQEVQDALIDDKLTGFANSADGQLAKASATQSFPLEAKKPKEEYSNEPISGTIGSGGSQPVLPQGAPSDQSNQPKNNQVSVENPPVGLSMESDQSYHPKSNQVSVQNPLVGPPTESDQSYYPKNNQVNVEIPLVGPSTESGDSPGMASNSRKKRSKNKKNGENQTKKPRNNE